MSKNDDYDDSYKYGVKKDYTQARELYKKAAKQEGASSFHFEHKPFWSL